MRFKYSLNKLEENMAKASGRDLGISTKKSVEICKQLKGKQLQKAQATLQRVIAKEIPIRMTRFNRDTPHRRGMGPGRYPVKAAKEILTVLKSVEANAQNLGLSTKDLVIVHMAAHKASRPWHFGRQRRRKMKRTHIEVVVQEIKQEKKAEEKKKENKK